MTAIGKAPAARVPSCEGKRRGSNCCGLRKSSQAQGRPASRRIAAQCLPAPVPQAVMAVLHAEKAEICASGAGYSAGAYVAIIRRIWRWGTIGPKERAHMPLSAVAHWIA